MRDQWLAMEHSRLHQAEQWPAGPRRDAQIRAVRSAIEQLSLGGAVRFNCVVCRAQKLSQTVIEIAVAPRLDVAA